VARAPGRLDVMGGIADYSGSLVLQVRLLYFLALPSQSKILCCLCSLFFFFCIYLNLTAVFYPFCFKNLMMPGGNTTVLTKSCFGCLSNIHFVKD